MLKNKKQSFLIIIFIIVLLIAFDYNKNDNSYNNSINNNINPTATTSIIITNNIEDNPKYKVVRVVDGDTIKVAIINNSIISDNIQTVRMIGVDTPETVDPRKVVQCFGREASDWSKKNLKDKTIQLEIDNTQGDRDKYNRLLRYVILDNKNYNKELILNGYGYEYTYNKSNPYNYQEEFKDAERYARENRLGLWADNACGEKNI